MFTKITNKIKSSVQRIKKRLAIKKKGALVKPDLAQISKKEAFLLGLIFSLMVSGIILVPNSSLAAQLSEVGDSTTKTSTIVKQTNNKIFVFAKTITYSAVTGCLFLFGMFVGSYISFKLFIEKPVNSL